MARAWPSLGAGVQRVDRCGHDVEARREGLVGSGGRARSYLPCGVRRRRGPPGTGAGASALERRWVGGRRDGRVAARPWGQRRLEGPRIDGFFQGPRPGLGGHVGGGAQPRGEHRRRAQDRPRARHALGTCRRPGSDADGPLPGGLPRGPG